MTFIQPNKHSSFLNVVLGVLAVALVAGVLGMVALYNSTVNLSHNIAEAKQQLDAVGAATTELNNKVVATLGGAELAKLTAEINLVAESKPQYFPIAQTVGQKWPIASHY